MTYGRASSTLVTIDDKVGAAMGALLGYEVYQRRRGLMASTIRHRRLALQRASEWLAPTSLLDATPAQLEAWMDTMALTSRSRSWKVSTLSCFFEYALREGLVAENPTRRIDRPRNRRYLPRPIQAHDLALAFAHADLRMAAWLGLGAFQGLRCAEIAQLRGEDVRRGVDPMLVVMHGKGDHMRVLPLNRRVELALGAVGLPASGPVFVRPHGGTYTPANVSQRINAYLHRLGIGATAHCLRHHFASAVYRRTHDLRLVQELLGHSSPATTAIYTAWSLDGAEDVVRDLDVA